MNKKIEIQEWFKPLYQSIIKNLTSLRDIMDVNITYEKSGEDKNINNIEVRINDFYSFLDWLKINWKSKENSKYEGSINFMSLKQVLYNWDEEFGGESWAPDMKGFRPLDMFYESAGCVGFFIDRKDKKGLYLYKFDGQTQSLDIDFEAYLKLLGMSKGYGWWQNSLIEIATGNPQPNVKAFKEEMPKIFPDFNWEEFVELYQSLRLSKNK